eukprot:TRINITY_DN15125_c0_g1_i1.p1 TRINITY_DN15125_c0_g1~~TRINITY_DN15125_c0_g1_i1.p1  ORF type:complete len:154 (-),score=28.42 TRINITY_DN15125_c0_g1_i1:64-525(-)
MAFLSDPLLQEFKYPILTTFGYFVLYYLYIIQVIVMKFRLEKEVKEKWRSNHDKKDRITLVEFVRAVKDHPRMYVAERTQLNMLEQMVPFLFGFWLYCLVVDPIVGSQLGMLYIVFRSIYPFFYGSWLLPLLSTGPNYVIILYFFSAVVAAVL